MARHNAPAVYETRHGVKPGAGVQTEPSVPLAQRVVVSNLPPGTSDTELLHILNTALCASALSTAVGPPVRSVHVDARHRCAVAGVRSATEAASLLRFDGVECRGAPLALRRPSGLGAKEVRDEIAVLCVQRVACLLFTHVHAGDGSRACQRAAWSCSAHLRASGDWNGC